MLFRVLSQLALDCLLLPIRILGFIYLFNICVVLDSILSIMWHGSQYTTWREVLNVGEHLLFRYLLAIEESLIYLFLVKNDLLTLAQISFTLFEGDFSLTLSLVDEWFEHGNLIFYRLLIKSGSTQRSFIIIK